MAPPNSSLSMISRARSTVGKKTFLNPTTTYFLRWAETRRKSWISATDDAGGFSIQTWHPASRQSRMMPTWGFPFLS